MHAWAGGGGGLHPQACDAAILLPAANQIFSAWKAAHAPYTSCTQCHSSVTGSTTHRKECDVVSVPNSRPHYSASLPCPDACLRRCWLAACSFLSRLQQPRLFKIYRPHFPSSAHPRRSTQQHPSWCSHLINPVFSFYGVDVSQPTSVDSFACLKGLNLRFAIVRCFESVGRPDPNCAQTVKNAHAGGMEQVRAFSPLNRPYEREVLLVTVRRWTPTCSPAPPAAPLQRKSHPCTTIGLQTV